MSNRSRASLLSLFIAAGPSAGVAHAAPGPFEACSEVALGTAAWAPPEVEVEASPSAVLALTTDLAAADVALAQAEVGLAFAYRALSVEGVLAYGDGAVAPGAAFAALRLFGPGDALVAGTTTVQLRGGLFDVPVGLSADVYSAADRAFVSLPWTVDRTHEGWSATGGAVQVSAGALDLQLFGVEAFGAGRAGLGVRADLTLLDGLLVSGSAAFTLDEAADPRDELFVLDLKYATEVVDLWAEAALHTSAAGPTFTGFLQAERALGPVVVATRAELFSDGERVARRFGLALGVPLFVNALRAQVELRSDLGTEAEEAAVFQVVAAL